MQEVTMTVSGIKDGAGSTLTVIEGEMNVREYIMGIIKPSIRKQRSISIRMDRKLLTHVLLRDYKMRL
jgi:hypothetical protein